MTFKGMVYKIFDRFYSSPSSSLLIRKLNSFHFFFNFWVRQVLESRAKNKLSGLWHRRVKLFFVFIRLHNNVCMDLLVLDWIVSLSLVQPNCSTKGKKDHFTFFTKLLRNVKKLCGFKNAAAMSAMSWSQRFHRVIQYILTLGVVSTTLLSFDNQVMLKRRRFFLHLSMCHI